VSKEDYGRWMSAFRERDTGLQRSFDEVASGLASGTISRRKALRLAGAALLGSMVAPLAPGTAAAAVPCCERSFRCGETSLISCRGVQSIVGGGVSALDRWKALSVVEKILLVGLHLRALVAPIVGSSSARVSTANAKVPDAVGESAYRVVARRLLRVLVLGEGTQAKRPLLFRAPRPEKTAQPSLAYRRTRRGPVLIFRCGRGWPYSPTAALDSERTSLFTQVPRRDCLKSRSVDSGAWVSVAQHCKNKSSVA
jgi:hypothetical protein